MRICPSTDRKPFCHLSNQISRIQNKNQSLAHCWAVVLGWWWPTLKTTWWVGQPRILASVQHFVLFNIFHQFWKCPGIFRPGRQTCGYRCQNCFLWQKAARWQNHAGFWKGKGNEKNGWDLKVEHIYFHNGNILLFYLWKFCDYLIQTWSYLIREHCVYITYGK